MHFIKTWSHTRQLSSITDMSHCFSPSTCLLFPFCFCHLMFISFSFFSFHLSWCHCEMTQPLEGPIFFSLFSSVAFYYRSLLWIHSGGVSKSWQASSCSYLTLGRQLSAVQNVFLSIICTLKSLADALTYSQWPSKSIAHLSVILFYLNLAVQCEMLKERKKKC